MFELEGGGWIDDWKIFKFYNFISRQRKEEVWQLKEFNTERARDKQTKQMKQVRETNAGI